MLGSVMLVQVNLARVTAIWIGELHEIATFHEIVYEYDKNILNNWYTLQYQEKFLICYLILYACVDHSKYYKFYLKKLKNNNTAHLSYTNCSLNMNI